MIVSDLEDRFLLVRQPDHGLQSGSFACHWGNERTPAFHPRDQIIEAAARHDDGWISWEARPQPDPETGEPMQFFRVAREDHVAAYRRGIEEAVGSGPWTGLLVSMHGTGLYNDRYGTFRSLRDQQLSADEQALVGEFLHDQEDLRSALVVEATGVAAGTPPESHPSVWFNYLLLQVWDRLSLQFAWKLAADGEIDPLPHPDGSSTVLRCRNRRSFTLELDPYPFDDSPRVFPVNARFLPKRRYGDAADLLETYLAAPITVLECMAVAP